MNRSSGGHKPGFTPTQGQYLAFIDAYTRVNLRPPAEADIQRRFGVTPHPSIRWFWPSNALASFAANRGRHAGIEVLVKPENLPVLEMQTNQSNRRSSARFFTSLDTSTFHPSWSVIP